MSEQIRVLLSEEELDRKIAELGERISKDYEGESVHLICILKGSIFFTCELAKRITVPVTIDFMCVSSYGASTVSSGKITIKKDLEESIEGRNVIVIEDIIDTGRTLRYLLDDLSTRGPKSLKLCAMLDKPDRRITDVAVDYTGFEIPDEFVVGYGLDYDQRYRNLPYIGILDLGWEGVCVKKSYRGWGFYISLIVVVVLVWFLLDGQHLNQDDYNYAQFKQELADDEIKSVEVQPNRVYPTGRLDIVKTDKSEETLYVLDVSEAQSLMDKEKFTSYVVNDIPAENWLMNLLPLLLVFGAMFILFMIVMNNQAAGGGGGSKMMNFGKSRAKMTTDENRNVTFENVAGLREEKEELEEIVDFLKEPRKYTRLGARIPKGVLLVGPPGTGKTLLAKAVAGEAGVPFFSISGSDFVEMFVGVGASRVRDLFEDAKKNAPCIVFIDEIDAVARRRGTGMGGGHDEREQTLNQLLVEMDGFGVNEGIIVMAATNRVDILDPAIMRPGRFDRKVHVGRPDIGGREEILKVHAKNKPLAEDVDLKQIAQTTAGFTGADLENLLNEAAIVAAKENRSYIIQKDIKESFLKVGVGPEKKSRIITEKEKKITAYHESGHAILFHVLPDVGPVYTVSIIPTGGGAAGYTMPLPERDEMFDTKGRMLQQIIVSLGGRVAEELIFDDITTGASQDIKQATELAKAMVTKYGFSENVGLINYNNDDDEVFIGRDLAHTRGYGEGVASKIDEEVKRIIDECYAKARAIIQENSDVLHKSADLLLEKEKIGRDEFEALFQSGADVVTETTEE